VFQTTGSIGVTRRVVLRVVFFYAYQEAKRPTFFPDSAEGYGFGCATKKFQMIWDAGRIDAEGQT
jgi:hypothetical protein